jgi:DNA-binding CsgD family transcriptional regulator
MSTRVHDGISALSEKEKQTLRLIVRGHDAKSIARKLDLSVHTINERLRVARRKMAVSSSREAARLLLAAEGGHELPDPTLFGNSEIGEFADPGRRVHGTGRVLPRPQIILGVLLMALALGLLAFAAMPKIVSTAPSTPVASRVAPDAAVVDAARKFLVLLDQGRWEESYQAFGPPFRKVNTLQVWTDVSKEARAPLGPVLSRTLLSHEDIAAPPNGYQMVRFRTRFANKAIVEKVTLEHVDGTLRVVGVMIE